MSSWPQTEAAIVERLHDALLALPGVEVSDCRLASAHASFGGDCVLDLKVGDRDLELVLQINRAVYPRDVRQVLEQVRSYSRQVVNRLAVLAAASISPGAKDLLRGEGLGYQDSGEASS